LTSKTSFDKYAYNYNYDNNSTTQSLGGKGGQKAAADFYIHPDLALKKGCCLYFSEKVGPTQPSKKIHQKQKKSKHYNDLNRAMRTGGQNLCANAMQNFALNNNKEIPPPKKASIFHTFMACRSTF